MTNDIHTIQESLSGNRLDFRGDPRGRFTDITAMDEPKGVGQHQVSLVGQTTLKEVQRATGGQIPMDEKDQAPSDRRFPRDLGGNAISTEGVAHEGRGAPSILGAVAQDGNPR